MMRRILLAVTLMAIGAAGLALVQQWTRDDDHLHPATPEPPRQTETAESAHDRQLTLSPEALARAGIAVVAVGPGTAASAQRLPGVVEPHGYRVVDVTTLAAGSVLAVQAELGQTIRRGTVVARIRSPELTDEVRRWLTIKAEGDVVTQRLARTESLAGIGAASRQDVEEDRASLVRVRTELDTARLRLERFGVTESQLESMSRGDRLPEIFDVRAQAGGVVTARRVNTGQNVASGDILLTVADRSQVWVIADVFEADLGQVRQGDEASVVSEAFPGRIWTGRVTYLDPAIAAQTRTAKVRIDVDNRDGALRFGMFVSVALSASAGSSELRVPKAAVQSLGDANVVYVEVAPGRFVERLVQLGVSRADAVGVLSGLEPGDRVVTTGSFALRAERERLGWPPPTVGGHRGPG